VTFRALGLPAPAAFTRAVPAAELGVATTLLAAPRAGAAAALLLLGGFTLVLARVVRRGLDVSCGCFGAASAAPVTGVTLLRNALLLVAAVIAATFAEVTVPSFPAVVLTTTIALLGAVGVAAADVRRTTGSLWKVDVP
jgi:hypothetical protein